ncbi:MAG: HAD-IA family hydrolase [Pseudomonadota bacterium]
MLHAVVFDLDGTLLDTEPDFTLVLNQLLLKYGKAETDKATVRKFVSAGATSMVRQGFGLQEDDPRLPVLLQEFLALYSERIPQTSAALFDDIDLLIATLVENGIAWGIMTNKHRRFTEPLLTHFENFSTSGSLVCPDDVGVGKPDPAGILRVCDMLGVPPSQAVYVGDHPRDIEAARNAGMPALAVSWGYLPDAPHIDQWGADAVLHSPQELLTWCLSQ